MIKGCKPQMTISSIWKRGRERWRKRKGRENNLSARSAEKKGLPDEDKL
jgi:hypothetical protein